MTLDTLSWWRVSVGLECTRTPPPPKPNALEVLNALLKSVKSPGSPPKIAFHVEDTALQHQRLARGRLFPVTVVLFGVGQDDAQCWRDTLAEWLDSHPECNFIAQGIGALEERSAAMLPALAPDSAELCLDFLTPLPFKRSPGTERTRLSAQVLFEGIDKRVATLFGRRIGLVQHASGVELLPWYWHYEEIRHRSDSQKGTVQYYNGCAGKLYLRGAPRESLPWIALASEIHAGGPPGLNPLGYFRLHDRPVPYFDSRLADRTALNGLTLDLVRGNDAALELAERGGVPLDEARFAGDLAEALSSGSYAPEPYQAFRVQKKTGGERLVERLGLRDLVAQTRMNQLLAPVLDLTFSPSSVGYRKGRSREQALDMIREAIREGHRYVVEADIEDFFPSVDHVGLERDLDRVLPRADGIMRHLIAAVLRAPFAIEGALQRRERGLAQGSPLSPVLANLYLDAFDADIRARGGRLVRYADDFVILCRDRREAEQLLAEAQRSLEALGLGLKTGKTAVKAIAEGFDFLGERIDERSAEDPVAGLLPQKKPLVITEPFLMLAVNGDAIDVKRAGQLVETIPIRRVSEIIVFGKAVFSTALVQKCARFRIPLSLALESGYQIGTFAPDSRGFHDIAYRQARRYHALSDTERTAIAAEFARAKIENYIVFVEHSYRAGDARLITELRERTAAISACSRLEEIRGHEGLAARRVFAWLNETITDPKFRAPRRERLAPDRLNSALNFGYYLSYTRLNGLMRASGLNPYLGFLHAAEDDYETLVADVQELFRAHIDRLVKRLINTRVLHESDFVEAPKGLWLTRPAMKNYVLQFERMMGQPVGGIPLRDAMLAQVRALRNWLTEDAPLWLYRWRPESRHPGTGEQSGGAGEEEAPVESDS